jgi:chromosome partitioning protein
VKTIAFLNQKGGVGKTSCCHHLAGALSRAGRTVLLVDADPQASLTRGLLGPDEADALDPAGTIAAIFAADPRPASAFVRAAGWPGIDLVPGHAALAEANVFLPWEQSRADQGRLAAALPEAGGHDFCLIDCPPNLQGCSWAALAAADGYAVPLQPEDYGAQGVRVVLDFAIQARAAINPRLALLGLIVTMSDRRRSLHRLFEHRLRDVHGPAVLGPVLSNLVAFPEAITRRRPVAYHEPLGRAAAEAAAVAAELVERVERVESPGRPAARERKGVV